MSRLCPLGPSDGFVVGGSGPSPMHYAFAAQTKLLYVAAGLGGGLVLH